MLAAGTVCVDLVWTGVPVKHSECGNLTVQIFQNASVSLQNLPTYHQVHQISLLYHYSFELNLMDVRVFARKKTVK